MDIETFYATADATDLAEAVRRGEVTAAELTEACIARTEALNPRINAVAERLYDAARAEAAEATEATEAAGADSGQPFAGVPTAIKDLYVSMPGVPIHSGSALPPEVADSDSTLVTRFRAAGLIPAMTSTAPEFGVKLATESARFGVTRNPWNTDHTSGGSSGGAAALVAAGCVPVAHASDGGGSIRVPAACTGLVGLKPSRGRVPLTPDMSEGWCGMVVQHVIARSVRDSAHLLDLVSDPDPLSPYVAAPPRAGFLAAVTAEPRPLKLASFVRNPLGLETSPETLRALETAVAAAREAGHTVEEIDLPAVGRELLADAATVIAGSLAGTLRGHAARLGRRVEPELEPVTRILSRYGSVLSAADMAAALDRLGERARDILARSASYDAVLMPVLSEPPVRTGALDSQGADAVSEALLDRLRLTRLIRLRPVLDKFLDQSFRVAPWPVVQNVTGQPAIALPVHVTDSGLPLGIQAVGRIGDEESLLSLAAGLERVLGWRDRVSPLAAERTADASPRTAAPARAAG